MYLVLLYLFFATAASAQQQQPRHVLLSERLFLLNLTKSCAEKGLGSPADIVKYDAFEQSIISELQKMGSVGEQALREVVLKSSELEEGHRKAIGVMRGMVVRHCDDARGLIERRYNEWRYNLK